MLDSQVREIIKQLNISDEIKIRFTQGQCLQVEKQGNTATIIYGRRVELFRGLGLLAEHAGEDSYSTTQPARFKMDGMMLDCSRNGVMKLDEKRLTIDCRADDDFDDTEGYCNNFWIPAFSASIV